MKRTKLVVYSRDQHHVSRKDMDPDAVRVLYHLQKNGHIAYLVGGGVRDLLLHRKPKDYDISTDAHPNRIKKLFRNAFLIGRRFRLAHIKFGEKIIETSTFRREPEVDKRAEGEFFHKHDNTFGTPEEDAHRRDFTINALFYNIADFSVIDYVGGMKDLQKRTIRCIGNPDVRYKEDPIRMLRAIRFAARMDFNIEPRTWRSLRRNAAEALTAAPPRLLEELYRFFGYSAGSASFAWLKRSLIMGVLFPELAAFLKARRGRAADFEALLKAIDEGGDPYAPPKAELIFAVLLYGMFEVRCAEHIERGDHAGHEVVRELLEPLMPRLRIPRRIGDRLVHIMDAQRRFDEQPGERRFSRERFMAQETFVDALDFYAIRTAAGQGDPATLKDWQQWVQKHPPPEHAPRPTRRRRSGQRRSRGPRKKEG
jgi:poly(A) polymerase